MRTLISFAVFTSMAHAGLVRGLVLDHGSGRPLSRTIVRLEPIPGSTGKSLQVRSGTTGMFEFPNVPDGKYRLFSQREAFFDTHYRQRRVTGQGVPVEIKRDTDLFVELRMPRVGAITGSVFDENGVGIWGVPVVAYRAKLPLEIAAEGESDDRGVFRLAGLLPGKYWVRSGAFSLYDGSAIVPTFAPRAQELRSARAFEVMVGADTPDADVTPDFGVLVSLTVQVSCDLPDGVDLTLSSELGRRTLKAGCGSEQRFKDLAPGYYEITAETQRGEGSGFQEFPIRQDTTVPLEVIQKPTIEFRVVGAAPKDVSLLARRDDLSGLDEPREITLPRTRMAVGHWEMRATVGPSRYVENINAGNLRSGRPWRQERPTESHEVFIEQRGYGVVSIRVSDKAAQIHGKVAQGEAGVPVFLWPVAEANRRILSGPRNVLSDVEGKFEFTGLPPGDYRIVATYDAMEVTPELLEESKAMEVHLDPSQSTTIEVPRWISP